MSVLELCEVTRTYGEGEALVEAVRGVELTVEAGDLVAIMGPSGSGKSTLLTISGGLEEPTSGQVLVLGSDLTAMSANQRAALRRRSIGYVFQDYNLLPGLTAAENVALPLELDGLATRKARAAGLAALDELGLAERADRFPDELSGGERQRVAIARALLVQPQLLLMDEPVSSLDVDAKAEVLARLEDVVHALATPVIYVSHDPLEVRRLAHRVIEMRAGRLSAPVDAANGIASLAGLSRDEIDGLARAALRAGLAPDPA